MKRTLIPLLLLGVYLAWRFFGVDFMLARERASGEGWSSARADLTRLHTEQLDALLRENGVLLPLDAHARLTSCLVDDSIEALNATGCAYRYNKATTTEAAHVAEQEACLARVGWAQREEAIFVKCVQARFPNDWGVMSRALSQGAKQAMMEAGRDEASAARVGGCVAPKLVALLKGAGCPLINPQATTGVDLFGTVDRCVEVHDLAPQLALLSDTCAAEADGLSAP
ncbi:hypothetical protein KKB55_04070 [Myxococcota bacterium]|nr:hypothetical protein [Myxococcota bacterium]MBU1896927.1 hypothetical protein [Myxococcota bacterium]